MIMKKTLLTLLAFFAIGSAWADEVKVSPVEVRQGATGIVKVELVNTSGRAYRSFQFDMVLPEGVTFVKATKGAALTGEEGKYMFSTTDRLEDASRIGVVYTDFDGSVFSEGVIAEVEVQVDATIAQGTVLQGKLQGDRDLRPDGAEKIEFGYNVSEDGTETAPYRFDDVTFEIKVVENRIVFDENATELPTETGTQNVRVKRTIKGGQWSTICLPFAMTAEQMTKAFGEGVELAELRDHDIVVDDDDNITSISINFSPVTEFEANYPYIIKTAQDVTEFELDGVEVDVDDPLMEMDNGKTGSRRVVYRGMYGTYVAETVVPEYSLFISGNKFFYSTGATMMKGFRAWIELGGDVLTAVENGAKINFSVDGEATAIDGINVMKNIEGIYDLSGRKIELDNNNLNSLQKGVYIINGKKVTIK